MRDKYQKRDHRFWLQMGVIAIGGPILLLLLMYL